jgi:hypothetical protein
VKIQVRTYFLLNKDAAALGGTNCFILGTTEERIMIDSGDVPPINRKFIENLRKAMIEEKFRLKVRNKFFKPNKSDSFKCRML